MQPMTMLERSPLFIVNKIVYKISGADPGVDRVASYPPYPCTYAHCLLANTDMTEHEYYLRLKEEKWQLSVLIVRLVKIVCIKLDCYPLQKTTCDTLKTQIFAYYICVSVVYVLVTLKLPINQESYDHHTTFFKYLIVCQI